MVLLAGAGLTVAQDGVHLLSDHTGRASGEAFVYFVDKQSAQDALSRDREKIGHRWGVTMYYDTVDRPTCWCLAISLFLPCF